MERIGEGFHYVIVDLFAELPDDAVPAAASDADDALLAAPGQLPAIPSPPAWPSSWPGSAAGPRGRRSPTTFLCHLPGARRMPELPEVESVRRQLEPELSGRRVLAVWADTHGASTPPACCWDGPSRGSAAGASSCSAPSTRAWS